MDPHNPNPTPQQHQQHPEAAMQTVAVPYTPYGRYSVDSTTGASALLYFYQGDASRYYGHHYAPPLAPAPHQHQYFYQGYDDQQQHYAPPQPPQNSNLAPQLQEQQDYYQNPNPHPEGATEAVDGDYGEEKKIKQTVYCTTCYILCDTQEVLNIHNVGKKYRKNICKLQNSFSLNPQSEVTNEVLEGKKIIGEEAAPSEMKICTICNVVVNSQIVYDNHIARVKHFKMLKKQQQKATIVEG